MSIPLVDQDKWELVPFEGFPQHDTIWSMVRGADGNIYVGLCIEHTGGGIAQLFRYDVRRRRLEHCLDMAKVTGEPGDSGHASQGKIHFSLCAASDGKIYGTTHCTTPPVGHTVWSPQGTWDDPVLNYPGGHLFRYDPKTGEAVDFGILFRNEGIPFMVLDEGRGRLYGITYPKAHFFRCNLQGRDLVDYGRVSSWYPIGLTFDANKNIFTSDTNSRLIKYDVERDRLVFFGTAPYSEPWNRSMRFSWISNLDLAEDGKIYGTHYCNDRLFRFDPNEESPRFEDLGAGVPGVRMGLVRATTPDHRGHVYYAVYPQRLPVTDTPAVFARFHIADGTKEVLGQWVVNGVRIWSWIGVTDLEGNLYFKGNGRPMTLAVYRPGG